MSLGPPSPCADVVYHLLAHVTVPRGDASNLWHPGYVAFAAARWPATPPQERGMQPQELLALSLMYERDPNAHRLHAFHTGYADLEALMAGAKAAHESPLIDLFQIALWGQVRAGFEVLWDTAFAPLYRAHEEP